MKKEQVIESARELFTTYGYKKVSMDEIASKANVTKKTIYTYFKDKDELFRYFIIEEINKMKSIIEENEKKELPFFEIVHQTIYELLKYRKESKFLEVVTKESITLRNESIIKNLGMLDESIKEYIREKLEYAMKNKYIRECNLEIASFIIYKIYIALIYEWKKENKQLNEKEISDNIVKILKEGIFINEEEKE